MDCEIARDAMSALMDGEDPGVEPEVLEAHLQGCDRCRSWRLTAHELTRQVRLQPLQSDVAKPEELVRQLHEVFTASSRHDLLRFLRIGLLVVGLAQIAVTLPTLFTGGSDYAWDLLSLQVALAVGFWVCALRPSRASAFVLMMGTGSLMMVATAIVELARGRTDLLDEAPHVVTLVGWLLICFTSKRVPSDAESERIRVPLHLGQITGLWHQGTSHLRPGTTHEATMHEATSRRRAAEHDAVASKIAQTAGVRPSGAMRDQRAS